MSLKAEFHTPCHRSGNDIVIPQLLTRGAVLRHRINETRLPYRAFDSTFSGSSWGDRQSLADMYETEKKDYDDLKTEKYVPYFEGFVDFSLIYRGYFMYSACGMACWSQVSLNCIPYFFNLI